jgi:hypothetical protein
MEQLVRDVRISQIYEGANGIHAMDLVRRKLPMHDGRLVRRYFGVLDEFLKSHENDAAMREFTGPVAEATARLKTATQWLARAGVENPENIGAAAHDYLRLMALTAFGHMWGMSARVALEKSGSDNTGFYQAKLATARYFMSKIMPQTAALLDAITAGSDILMSLDAEAF